MTMRTPRPAGRLARRSVAAVAATLLFAGCDVTNPGLILDTDLNNVAAMGTLLNGVAGAFQIGLDSVGWDNAVLNGELAGASAYLSRLRHWNGNPFPEDADDFNSVYAGVWTAESSVERMKTVYGSDATTGWSKQLNVAEAYMWAGFALRLSGETLCKAVLNGGPAQPRTVYFTRAETAFTNAIKIAEAIGTAANTTRLSAYGGRASVRLILGNWAGALADAAVVPTSFTRNALFSTSSTRERNTIFNENRVRINLSANYTWFQNYYAKTLDPRTPVFKDPKIIYSADGVSTHYVQNKYPLWSSPIALTRGTEMRLIEAENQIVNGDWATGLAMVNAIRAAVPMPAAVATTKAEAFTALRLERGIVMWLESRRGGDILRWGGKVTDDPISIYAQPFPFDPVPLASRAICEPFSQTIISTNPNNLKN